MPQSDLSPSFRVIAAALRRTTEYLAAQPSCPDDTPPDWNDTEWRIAKAVVAMQGMAVQVATARRWKGPDHWEEFLLEQRRQTLLRHRHIVDRLATLDAGAREARIPVIALKGAALYRAGVYGEGERPMGDIDLLVSPGDVTAARQMLAAQGYIEALESWRHHTFEPRDPEDLVGFGENIANTIKIELHSRIAERLPVAETDISCFIFPRRPRPGLNDYPSPSALMLHLLLHAAGNIRARALRQIQLHDVARLAPRLSTGDWNELLAAASDDRGLWWALPPLALTARYYPGVVPTNVLATTLRGCPRVLARAALRHVLSDVSWSQIRIRAFPGIEWSASPAEAMKFALGRIWPKSEDLDLLRKATATQLWARHIPWYGQSHAVRIVRWLVSRPPRVQTLYSVRAALSDR